MSLFDPADPKWQTSSLANFRHFLKLETMFFGFIFVSRGKLKMGHCMAQKNMLRGWLIIKVTNTTFASERLWL